MCTAVCYVTNFSYDVERWQGERDASEAMLFRAWYYSTCTERCTPLPLVPTCNVKAEGVQHADVMYIGILVYFLKIKFSHLG